MQELNELTVNEETIDSTLDEFKEFYSQDNILKDPSEDFNKLYVDDITVISVNLIRATLLESQVLKKIIDDEIANGNIKLVVDISQCAFIDSTFLGTLVLSLRNIADKSGELKLVEPASSRNLLLTNTFTLFNLYKTQEEAIKSFS